MRNVLILAAVASLIAGSASAADKPLYKTRDCDKETVQMAMNQCAGDNLEAANKELNRIYGRMMSQEADKVSKAQLKDVEQSWIVFRDKECNFEIGPEENGGSIWPMDMNNCLQQKTDTRIRELKVQLTCPDEDRSCNKL